VVKCVRQKQKQPAADKNGRQIANKKRPTSFQDVSRRAQYLAQKARRRAADKKYQRQKGLIEGGKQLSEQFLQYGLRFELFFILERSDFSGKTYFSAV